MLTSKRVPRFRHAGWPIGLAAAAVSLAIMIATEPALAIVWDEGYTLGREARLRAWFAALRDPAAFAARWQPPVEDLVPPEPHSRAEARPVEHARGAVQPGGSGMVLAVRPRGTRRSSAGLCTGRLDRRPRGTVVGAAAPRPARADARLQPDLRRDLRLLPIAVGLLARPRGRRGVGISASSLRAGPLRDV